MTVPENHHSNLFSLSGKRALVTGSSRGIGRAIAEAFADHRANVVVASRNQTSCDAVAREINSRGRGRAVAVRGLIGDKVSLGHLVEAAHSAFGGIDILVCNAATNPYYGPMAGIADEQFDKVLRNNVLSTHWLAQLVMPEMIERRAGVIIIISSIGASRGSAVIGAYNLSKAADLQLTRNLAVELGPYDIRVNCITPGLIRTQFSRALWEDRANLEGALRWTPLGRIGEPEDVAGVAVFLASDAARYITGQSIVVDGGATVTIGGI